MNRLGDAMKGRPRDQTPHAVSGNCQFKCEYHFPCVECGEPHLGSHRPGCSHYGQSSGVFRCIYCETGTCTEHAKETDKPC